MKSPSISKAQDNCLLNDGDELMSLLDGLELPLLEQDPMLDLKFPSLLPSQTYKRPARDSFPFTAMKRRKMVSPILEDGESTPAQKGSCWIDSLLDSLCPEQEFFETASLISSHDWDDPQDIPNASELSNEELLLPTPPSRIVSAPAITHPRDGSSGMEGAVAQKDQCHRIPVQPNYTYVEPAAAIVSPPLLHQTENHQANEPQQPTNSLLSRDEPSLLTLTSYPFRVIHVNEAFAKLCGRKRTSMIGDSIFDIIQMEGMHLRPSLATYPTLLGRLESHVALVASAFASERIKCEIQVQAVTKRSDKNALRYFSVCFTPLNHQRHTPRL